MEIEIIAIGDEVLYGYTVNMNASTLSRRLLEAGLLVSKHHVVGDDLKQIVETIKSALFRGSFVITTGGLGPTCDDRTREAIAKIFNLSLKLDEKKLKELEIKFGDIGINEIGRDIHPETSIFKNQATVVDGVKLLSNDIGTAYGMYHEDEKLFPNAAIICLPGVPTEMKAMIDGHLIGIIKEKKRDKKRFFIRPIHFFHLIENDVDPLLREITKQNPEINCGVYPSYGTITVHLGCEAENESEFLEKIKDPYEIIMKKFSKNVFESKSGRIDEAVHNFLLKNKITLAIGESATGGALSERLVSYPDASQYFQGSIVAYSNEVKKRELNIDQAMLEKYGAVSFEVATKMAENVRDIFRVKCGVSITGIFGPSGGTKEKPVGLVFASIAMEGRETFTWKRQFKGSRQTISEKSIQDIFSQLYFFLLNT